MKLYECLDIMLRQWDHIAMYNCSKGEAVKALGLPIGMYNNCACCEYDKQFTNDCNQCPIEWPSDCTLNHCGHSYYGQWSRYKDSRNKFRWARKIADLALDRLNELFPERR